MFQYWVALTLLAAAAVPGAHSFKSNSSLTIYHIVDELGEYIRSELKQLVNWPGGNQFIGPGHRFAINDRYCGDFSTITILDEPTINATYNKRLETMTYQCQVVLGMLDLHFGFSLDLNVVGQSWDASDVRITAEDNAWEVLFEVQVKEDGFCKVQYVDSAIIYLGNYDVAIEPQNHFIRKWTIWLLTRGIVFSYHETWNEMLKSAIREEFKSPGVIEIICKGFTSRNP